MLPVQPSLVDKQMRCKTASCLVRAALAALVVIAAAAPAAAAVRALLLVVHFTFPQSPLQPLEIVTGPPVVTEMEFLSTSGRNVSADLYLPAGNKVRRAAVLYCPLASMGIKDPYIVRIAEGLARSGTATLVPKAQRSPGEPPLDTGDTEDVISSVRCLQEQPSVNGIKVGLMGISYGSSPVLRAASRPELAGRVECVFSLGGCFDLKNVLKYAVTGNFEYGSTSGTQKPREYVRTVLIKTILAELKGTGFFSEYAQHPEKLFLNNREVPGDVPAEAAALLRLISARDSVSFENEYRRLPHRVRRKFAALSPYPVLGNIHTRVILLHSQDDPYIPFTESMRLYDSLRGRVPVTLGVFDILDHTVPKEITWENLVSSYIPGLYHMVKAAYFLLD